MTAPNLAEVTVGELQSLMRSGEVTARALVDLFRQRIRDLDENGPGLRAVIETNPAALDLAEVLDRERQGGAVRGALHGIPILIKDNIDTKDEMATTAGSLALLGSHVAQDACVVRRLREAGAVLLGKANMSEWANFRSTRSSSGWSARGGQALNPYVLDRSPCGSSSGSASAVAAGLVPVSLGTETDGSILCPAAFNGVVGIKPTVGLTSRAGVIPISHSQDTVGPFARTVAEAALVLGVIGGVDPADPATQASARRAFADYTAFLDPGGLRGARIGVPRETYFGYSPKADVVAETALEVMRAAGAVIVDPADIPTAQQMRESDSELEVMLHEFKAGIDRYLAAHGPAIPQSLAEVIAFNEAHAGQELIYFGQELFIRAQDKGPLTDSAYGEALAKSRCLSRQEGIDALMDRDRLDALVMPTTSPAAPIDLVNGDHFTGGSAQPAALAGYPAISVPAGFAFGLPVGLTFMGRAYSEPTLIKLAYAFEQASRARRPPEYWPTLPGAAP